MKHDNVIRILFIEDSVEDAELLINVLRTGGIAVRPARATKDDEIRTALDELQPDLVVLNPSVAGVETDAVMRHIDASGRDMTLVAVVEGLDTDAVADLFASGARGVALRRRSDQVLAVWCAANSKPSPPGASCAAWKPPCAKPNAAATPCSTRRAMPSPTFTKACT